MTISILPNKHKKNSTKMILCCSANASVRLLANRHYGLILRSSAALIFGTAPTFFTAFGLVSHLPIAIERARLRNGDGLYFVSCYVSVNGRSVRAGSAICLTAVVGTTLLGRSRTIF
jgi:hypothetical protein